MSQHIYLMLYFMWLQTAILGDFQREKTYIKGIGIGVI